MARRNAQRYEINKYMNEYVYIHIYIYIYIYVCIPYYGGTTYPDYKIAVRLYRLPVSIACIVSLTALPVLNDLIVAFPMSERLLEGVLASAALTLFSGQ